MAVNAQDDVAHKIWQIGIWNESGHGDTMKFVYADTSPTGIPITSPTPVSGHRYEFRIVKNSSGKVRQVIYENGAQIWSHTSAASWSANMKFAWWGYETGQSTSMPGIDDNDSHADLVGQYSLVNDGGIHTYTGIVPDSTCPNNPCETYWPYTEMSVHGANAEIFNVTSP